MPKRQPLFAGIAAGLSLLWLCLTASAQPASSRPACSGDLTEIGRLICDDFLLSWQDAQILGEPRLRWQEIEERCAAVLARPLPPPLARLRNPPPKASLRDCVADELLQAPLRRPQQLQQQTPASPPLFAGKDAAVACLPDTGRLEVRFPVTYGAGAVTKEVWLPPGSAASDRFKPIAASEKVDCRFADGRALRVGRGTQDDIRIWADKRLVAVVSPGRRWVSRVMLIGDVLWECSALLGDTAARCLAVQTVPGSAPIDKAEFPDPDDAQAGRFALLYAEDEILCRALIEPAAKPRERVLVPSNFRRLGQSGEDARLRVAISDSLRKLPFHVDGYRETYVEADTGRPERDVLILDDRDQRRQASLLAFNDAEKKIRRLCWLEARGGQ